jgi:hypothetical protein
MKNTSFSYPLDMWINEGGALAREASSACALMRLRSSVDRPRWICRFSPRTFRRSYSMNPRRVRRNHCVLKIR